MAGAPFRISCERDGPLVAVALHNGHELRHELAGKMLLGEADRLREEDPHTGRWTSVGDVRVVIERSRFEFDLNRPRGTAIYRHPEDSWGLRVWREDLSEAEVGRSLAEYDAFYAAMHGLLSGVVKRFGFVVVYDLHSYNHLRDGPDGRPADPDQNPEVNVGTGSLDRARWGAVVDRFMDDMRAWDFFGRSLDVRENVKFRGRELARWCHERFPGSACVLAIEFKKVFMDEWSGELKPQVFDAIAGALGGTTAGVVAAARGAAAPAGGAW